jgi:hypothetical protein
MSNFSLKQKMIIAGTIVVIVIIAVVVMNGK